MQTCTLLTSSLCICALELKNILPKSTFSDCYPMAVFFTCLTYWVTISSRPSALRFPIKFSLFQDGSPCPKGTKNEESLCLSSRDRLKTYKIVETRATQSDLSAWQIKESWKNYFKKSFFYSFFFFEGWGCGKRRHKKVWEMKRDKEGRDWGKIEEMLIVNMGGQGRTLE